MTRNYKQELTATLASKIGIGHELFTDEAKLFSDLGMDSFDLVYTTMMIEDEFDIHVPADDMEAWSTFGEMVAYIAAACDAKTAG